MLGLVRARLSTVWVALVAVTWLVLRLRLRSVSVIGVACTSELPFVDCLFCWQVLWVVVCSFVVAGLLCTSILCARALILPVRCLYVI